MCASCDSFNAMRCLLLALFVCGCATTVAPEVDEVAPIEDEDPATPLPALGHAPLAPTGGCNDCPPQTLSDILDGGTWRFDGDVDEALVAFVRDEDDAGVATFTPIAGTSFPCAGEGRWSVLNDEGLVFEFPPGCGGQWLDVEWFDDVSMGGWLSQVTPMNAFKNP
jgi:hypothetical protein